MRLAPVAFLVVAFSLACGGGAPDPAAIGGADAPSAPAATPAVPVTSSPLPRAAPSLADVGSPADAALADHWLVIVASDRDPAKPPPIVATSHETAPVGAKGPAGGAPKPVRQLNSGRFKNLMPCYAVWIADATPEKADALALSKAMKGQGIDNYVKNAGAWVGPSAAIDAYCAGQVSGGDTDAVVLATVAEHLWLPLDAPEAVLTNALRGAPAPEAMTNAFDAWKQPVKLDTVGAVTMGAGYRAVDAASGVVRSCKVNEIAALTLGVPHFGVLQEGPPARPACGEPKLYAHLGCDGPTDTGTWIAVPADATVHGFVPAEQATAAQIEAAKAVLTRDTDWDAAPEGMDGEPVTRDVTVRHWRGPAGKVALVEGTREAGEAVCGGDQQGWAAVFALDGDALGAPLGGFVSVPFGEAVGVVDVGADGRPEVVTTGFPTTTTLTATDGSAVTSLTTDFCDCPC